MPKGGKRKGAGRPKGSKSAARLAVEAVQAVAQAQAVAALAEAVQIATVSQADLLDKEAQRLALRALILPRLRRMTEAQMTLAEGLSYLVTRDKKSGKFIRVGPAMAGQAGEETIEVWEKDPSTHAYDSLVNRALDKPAEQVQEIKVTGSLDIVAVLQSARKRLAHARPAA